MDLLTGRCIGIIGNLDRSYLKIEMQQESCSVSLFVFHNIRKLPDMKCISDFHQAMANSMQISSKTDLSTSVQIDSSVYLTAVPLVEFPAESLSD